MTYLIGARARFVLVEADDEQQARERGERALSALYRDIGVHDLPVEGKTVRPATEDEIRRWNARHCSST